MRRRPVLLETSVAILFIVCAFYFLSIRDTSEKAVQSVISAAFIILFVLFYSRQAKARLPVRVIFTGWFIIATLFGVVLDLYVLLPWYDSLVHLLSGAALVYLAKDGIRQLSADYMRPKVLYALFFSISISTLWEIYEFGVDFIGADSQHGSLADTMWDLVFGTLGAVLGAVILYHSTRKKLKKADRN